MRATVGRLEKSAKVVRDAHQAAVDAKREYTISKATKRQENTGSRDDRDDKATLDTVDLYKSMDTAAVAHAYARDLQAVLEKKLSGLQTEAKLIMMEYQTSGRV